MEGTIGLINNGNMCYLNASLQVISHLPFIKDLLILNEKNINKTTMTYQLVILLKSLWNNNNTINPIEFKKKFVKLRDNFFIGSNQHDAEEAFSCIIETMHEELSTSKKISFVVSSKNLSQFYKQQINLVQQINNSKNEYDKQNLNNELINLKKMMPDENLVIKSFRVIYNYNKLSYSIITKYLTGYLHSNIKCPTLHCGYSSNKFDPCSHITLSIPSNAIDIYDCIKNFSIPETLDDKNLWKCKNCNNYVNATKSISIWKSPTILVLQLKRFNYSTKRKNAKLIKFPINNLNIAQFISPISYKLIPDSCYEYNLVSIINHSGSMNNGHYYSYCKNIDNKWYNYDDTIVNTINKLQLITSNAYLLFYVRNDKNYQ